MAVAVGTGVEVGLGVTVFVAVGIGVAVLVAVGCGVGVLVAVGIGVDVLVGVAVGTAVGVGVGVGSVFGRSANAACAEATASGTLGSEPPDANGAVLSPGSKKTATSVAVLSYPPVT